MVREGGLLRRTTKWVPSAVLILAVLLLLEALGQLNIIPANRFPPPSEVAVSLADLIGSGVVGSSMLATLSGWASGLAIGSIAGVLIGIAVGLNQRAYQSTRFLVDFLRPIPAVALLPLFLLLFTGQEVRMYLVALGAFFPILLQTIAGVRDIDPVLRSTARAYGFTRFGIFRHIILRSSAPYIATGMRLAAIIALAVGVGVELVIGLPGLGSAIYLQHSALQMARMYALTIATGVLGLVIVVVFSQIEARILSWHPSYRKQMR